MAISIMNGAVLKFEIDFTVPSGTNLSQIDVKDDLELGLDVLDVTCSVNGADKVPGTDAGYTLTKRAFNDDIANPNSSFTLTIEDPDVINSPTEDQNIKVIVSAAVKDFSLLPAIDPATNKREFINEAHIIPYVNGAPAGDVSSEETVEFSEYRLYGFGGSDTIARQKDQDTDFPIHIPTFDAYSSIDAGGNPALKYVVNLTPNPELGVTLTEDDVKVYDYNADGTVGMLVKDTDFTVDTATAGVLKVTIPHSDKLRSSTIYIVPTGKTSDEITKHNTNPVYSRTTLSLDDDAATVLSADPFDVTTNINDDLITLVKKTLV